MEGLKENIHRQIANIPAEQLKRVNQTLFHQHKKCLHVQGQHFKKLL
jgi:hypothetical protein